MIKRIKSKLSVKIFILTALIMAACCIVTYSFIAWFVPRIYTYDLSEVEHMAYELSDELSYLIPKEFAPTWLESTNQILQEFYEEEFVLHLFQNTGKELSLQDLSIIPGKTIEDYDGVDMTKQYTLWFVDDTADYKLFITRNTDKVSQVVETLNKALPSLSIVIVIASVISAFLYSWYVTAPIKRVSKLSKQMANMDFNDRCTNTRTDEIGVLSNSLNELSGKLVSTLSELQIANTNLQSDIDKERQLERQRLEFFSAVSHELKTPITIIKGQLQGMLCGVGRYKDRETYLAQSIKVTETLEKMVQELLTISRLETPGYTCNKANFNFSELLNNRLTAHEDLFIQTEMALKKSILHDIYLHGDLQLLQKAVDNLLSNALLYSPIGNTVSVNLWQEANNVFLCVENTGGHILDEAIPKLFEAFYRVEQSRNRQTGGSGLGLYIVKTILDLHNAKIQISNSPNGVIATIQF